MLNSNNYILSSIISVNIVCFIFIPILSMADLRLPWIESVRLMKLFMEQDVALQFDISKEIQLEYVLLSIEKSSNGGALKSPPLFRLSTSTEENIIKLEFRSRDGRQKVYRVNAPPSDGDSRRLIFVMQGKELIVVENCRQLMRIIDEDIDFRHVSSERLMVVTIGGDHQHHNADENSKPKMREFTADAGNPLALKCPTLEVIIDNAMSVAFVALSAELGGNGLEADGRRHQIAPRSGSVDFERQILPNKSASSGRLAERVDYLEGQMDHWNQMLQRLDIRVKKVELTQRGCQMDDRILSLGEKQQDLLNCTECQCSGTGVLHCRPIGCPRLDCAHPIRVHGKCCPECGKQCFYNGRHYENGETYRPKECVQCLCENGQMECQFKMRHHCPILECPTDDQVTPEGECCPVCANVDHCAANPQRCHEFADCESGPFSAKCTCKTGFFGNGVTSCYDIDECLWDRSTRAQLNGCQTGTICINLPGSFKCDCLPGYQKIDEWNCLDTIRT